MNKKINYSKACCIKDHGKNCECECMFCVNDHKEYSQTTREARSEK